VLHQNSALLAGNVPFSAKLSASIDSSSFPDLHSIVVVTARENTRNALPVL